MDIKTYQGVLYAGNNIKKKYKISQNTRIAPRHNLKDIGNYTVHKGHTCMFLSKKNGSVTVEASLCVPVFFLVLFSLFYIFQCLYRINYIEDSLADCAREYAVSGTKTSAVTALADEKVIIKYDEDARLPVCHVSYKMKIPFLGSEFFKLDFYQQMVINNYSGRSMSGDGGEEEEAGYVYITKNGKVYHCNKKCTYLKPSVKEIKGNDVWAKRNSSGGKYKACEKCCKNIDAKELTNVYITTYGDRYHKYGNCPKIKRDIRRVKKQKQEGFLHVVSAGQIKMQILLYIILGASLVICTITDLKYKEIYMPVIIAGAVLILCLHICQQSISLADAAGALIVCLFFSVSSVVTRGQFGMGDAFLFTLTGLGLGAAANIFIIMFSFILAFCAAIFLIVVKHKQHNYCMPLAPFVLGSFIFYVAGIYIPL